MLAWGVGESSDTMECQRFYIFNYFASVLLLSQPEPLRGKFIQSYIISHFTPWQFLLEGVLRDECHYRHDERSNCGPLVNCVEGLNRSRYEAIPLASQQKPPIVIATLMLVVFTFTYLQYCGQVDGKLHHGLLWR